MSRVISYRAPLIAVSIGAGVGVATSFLQTHLDLPWLAVANSVSPWLTTAFAAGALQSKMRSSILVAVAATLAQVAGYYATSEMRGFDASLYYVGLWTVCALIGGPVFGAAGFTWRKADPPGIGVALLSAAYITEGVVGYQIRLGYTSSAVLFVIIGIAIAIGLGRHRGQYRAVARWIVPALAAGVAGQLALGLVAG